MKLITSLLVVLATALLSLPESSALPASPSPIAWLPTTILAPSFPTDIPPLNTMTPLADISTFQIPTHTMTSTIIESISPTTTTVFKTLPTPSGIPDSTVIDGETLDRGHRFWAVAE
ncbi:hypothetical protein V8E51_009541 [Hyaloscypha variabilis]